MTSLTHTEDGPRYTQLPLHGAAYSFASRLRRSKALLPSMAVLVVTSMALAAALLVSHSEARSGNMAAVGYEGDVEQPVAAAPRLPQQAQPARTTAPRITAQAARATACADCGTVETVTAVQRSAPVQGIGGSKIGVGAVAGGVIGGLLGNQVGHGNGRAAATVLGAVGGGYAGNAIEQKMHSVTVYQVQVRMADGSSRSFEQSAAIAAGARVRVEGSQLRTLPAPAAQS